MTARRSRATMSSKRPARIAGLGRAHAADRKRGRRAATSGSNASACRPAARSSCAARPTGCFSCRDEERERGVVAFSSGNHARGVAIAARRLGIRGDHRHAGRRAGGEGRRHARRRAPRSSSTTGAPRAARRSPRELPRRPGRPSCRASTIRTSSPGRAPSGSRSSSSSAGAAARGSSFRAAAAGWRRGSRLACPDAEIVVVEPEGWDDMRRSLELGEIVPVGAGRAADALRRAPDPARLADHLRHPARARGATALSVSDDEVAEAVRFAWDEHRAGRRAGRRGGAGGAARGQGSSRAKARSWCCRAGMSIRRFTRGSSRRA